MYIRLTHRHLSAPHSWVLRTCLRPVFEKKYRKCSSKLLTSILVPLTVILFHFCLLPLFFFSPCASWHPKAWNVPIWWCHFCICFWANFQNWFLADHGQLVAHLIPNKSAPVCRRSKTKQIDQLEAHLSGPLEILWCSTSWTRAGPNWPWKRAANWPFSEDALFPEIPNHQIHSIFSPKATFTSLTDPKIITSQLQGCHNQEAPKPMFMGCKLTIDFSRIPGNMSLLKNNARFSWYFIHVCVWNAPQNGRYSASKFTCTVGRSKQTLKKWKNWKAMLKMALGHREKNGSCREKTLQTVEREVFCFRARRVAQLTPKRKHAGVEHENAYNINWDTKDKGRAGLEWKWRITWKASKKHSTNNEEATAQQDKANGLWNQLGTLPQSVWEWNKEEPKQ